MQFWKRCRMDQSRGFTIQITGHPLYDGRQWQRRIPNHRKVEKQHCQRDVQTISRREIQSVFAFHVHGKWKPFNDSTNSLERHLQRNGKLYETDGAQQRSKQTPQNILWRQKRIWVGRSCIDNTMDHRYDHPLSFGASIQTFK